MTEKKFGERYKRGTEESESETIGAGLGSLQTLFLMCSLDACSFASYPDE